MLIRRYDRKGIKQAEQKEQLAEQGLEQVSTGKRRDETDVTVTDADETDGESDMPKYVKSTDRSRVVEQAKEDKANDYALLSTEELEGITNNDLKAYLDEQGVEYPSKVNKDELIALVTGK